MLPGKRYTVDDVLSAVMRRWWMPVVPWIVVGVGTFLYARALPDRYRSFSVIQVIPPRVMQDYVRTAGATNLGERLPAISQQILSRTRLERIIQDFNLYGEERRKELMEDIVGKMRNTDIRVQPVKGDAFQVEFFAPDARTAMKVTERLASLYVEENLRDREGMIENANQFLESQVDDARRRLLEHEKTLEEYTRAHDGELPAQVQSNLQAIQSLQTQVQALVDSVSRDRDRRLLLERMLADANAEAPVQAPAVPVVAAAEVENPTSAAAQLAQAKKALDAMQLRLKPEHPDVTRAKRLIRDLEKKAESEALQVPVSVPVSVDSSAASRAEATRTRRLKEIDDEMKNLDRQIAAKEDNTRKLHAAIANYQSRADAAPTRGSEMIALTRDYQTLQNLYVSLLSKNEDAKITANLERRQIGEQFKVVDPARLPERPFSPDRSTIDAIGAVVGLALGLGLIALLEFMDNSFRTEEDVVAVLSMPVLASVPVLLTKADKLIMKRRQRLVAVGSVVTVLLVGGVAVAAWKLHFMDWLR
jgi:polysaccharide chain length determinant protein (PEP-CTERM system associated)